MNEGEKKENILDEVDSRCLFDDKFVVPDGYTQIGEDVFFASSLKQIILPESVTKIGDGAFHLCDELSEINLPDGVFEIGKEAFSGCVRLKSINLPKSLKKFGDNAFTLSGIKEVVFPKQLETVGKEAFRDSLLVRVKMNDVITSISEYAFTYCKKLEEVEFGENIISIGTGAFSGSDAIKKIELPKGLKEIDAYAFSWCSSLKEADLGEELLVIGKEAFYYCDKLETVKIPNTVIILDHACFAGCKSLKVIELPNGLERIGTRLFGFCTNLEHIILNGKKIVATGYIKSHLNKCYNFLNYATKNNLFIPKNSSIMGLIRDEDIPKFYAQAKEWSSILNKYTSKWKDEMVIMGSENHHAVENLFQICMALGLFEGGKTTEEAMEFIEGNILLLNPETTHKIFDGLDIKKYGYREEFAKFYIKNFNGNVNFLSRHEYAEDTDWGDEIIDYTAGVYNNWEQIKAIYPNKTVIADRERASENNNLTPDDVIGALIKSRYVNVALGNEKMLETVCYYGYTQAEFEKLQDIYEQAKKIQPQQMVLRVEEDKEQKGVCYKLLDKTDPEALILGEKTNCCQVVNGAGASCVEYGVTKENSGFIKFTVDDKIVGQSWVWYNKNTGIVCLDNIEIPTVWLKRLENKNFEKSFLDCLVRVGSAIKAEMEKNGNSVKAVTIGSGYNDLGAIRSFKKIKTDEKCLPEDYDGYSDATDYQYIIPIAEKTYKKDDETIK